MRLGIAVTLLGSGNKLSSKEARQCQVDQPIQLTWQPLTASRRRLSVCDPGCFLTDRCKYIAAAAAASILVLTTSGSLSQRLVASVALASRCGRGAMLIASAPHAGLRTVLLGMLSHKKHDL